MQSQQSHLGQPVPPSSNRRISSGIFEASPAGLDGAEQNCDLERFAKVWSPKGHRSERFLTQTW